MALFCFLLLLCRWEGRWRGTENKWECWCIRSKRHRLWRETGWTTGWPFSERLCRWRHVDRIGQEGHRKIRRERLRMATCSGVNETESVHDDEYCLSDEMFRWFFPPSDFDFDRASVVCVTGACLLSRLRFSVLLCQLVGMQKAHTCVFWVLFISTHYFFWCQVEVFWLDCIWNGVCSWICTALVQ